LPEANKVEDTDRRKSGKHKYEPIVASKYKTMLPCLARFWPQYRHDGFDLDQVRAPDQRW
jgi:hypothetical protein